MEGICKGIDVAITQETLFVDGHRLQEQIDELSSFSDTPPPSVTRILFTENDVAARSALPCGDDVYEKIFTESFWSEESFGFCH